MRVKIQPQPDDPYYHDITAKRGGQWLGGIVYSKGKKTWGLESDSDTIWTIATLKEIIAYIETIQQKR